MTAMNGKMKNFNVSWIGILLVVIFFLVMITKSKVFFYLFEMILLGLIGWGAVALYQYYKPQKKQSDIDPIKSKDFKGE